MGSPRQAITAPSGAPLHEWQPALPLRGRLLNSRVAQTAVGSVVDNSLTVVSFPGVTVGNCVAIAIISDDNFFDFSTPQIWDDGSNGWSQIVNNSGGANGYAEIWIAGPGITPLQNVYINRMRSGNAVAFGFDMTNILDFSGLSNGANANTTTPSTGTVNSYPNLLLLGLIGAQSNSSAMTASGVTPGFANSPLTTATDNSSWTTGIAGYFYVEINRQLQSYSATINANQNWAAVIVGFDIGAGPAPAPPVQGPAFHSVPRSRPGMFGVNHSLFVQRSTPASVKYTQSLSGGLSFTGSESLSTGKGLSGSLSFTGSQSRSLVKLLSGSLSFTGSISKAISKSISGGLSFTGSIAKAMTKTMSGGLSFTGSLARSLAKLLSGSLSFTGSQTRLTQKLISGGLSFTGSQTRIIGKSISGSLSFTGSLARRVGKSMSAGLSFTGSQIRSLAKGLSGSLSFTGSIVKASKKTLTSANLTFTGSMSKLTGHAFSGSLSFVGSQARSVAKGLSAGLSFLGLFSTTPVIASVPGNMFVSTYTAGNLYISTYPASSMNTGASWGR